MIVIAFYHMDKTGGTSIMQWFVHQRAAVFHYGQASCFFSLPQHADLFGRPQHTQDKACREKLSNDGLLDTTNATSNRLVYVELHAHVKYMMWNRLLPKIAQLRQRHKIVLSFALVREPVSHMLSHYGMWAPRVANRTTMPIEEWLNTSSESHGLQTRELAASGWMRDGTWCDTTTAVERLQLIDVACTTRWMHTCMGRIAAVIGRPYAREDMVRVAPQGSQGRARHELAKVRGQLPYSLLLGAARCDQRLLDQEEVWVHTRLPAVDPFSSAWHRKSVAGHCGMTTRRGLDACLTDAQGAFRLPKAGLLGGWETAGPACAELCRRCANCHFISVSLLWADCSWYRRCDLNATTALEGSRSATVLPVALAASADFMGS